MTEIEPYELEEKRRTAYQLYVVLRSYREVAREMGEPRSSVHRWVQEYIKDTPQDDAHTARRLAIDTLALARKTMLEDIATGSRRERQAAVAQLVRVEERLSKLLGTDAAAKVDIQTDGGRSDAEKALDDLIREADQKVRAEERELKRVASPDAPPPWQYP